MSRRAPVVNYDDQTKNVVRQEFIAFVTGLDGDIVILDGDTLLLTRGLRDAGWVGRITVVERCPDVHDMQRACAMSCDLNVDLVAADLLTHLLDNPGRYIAAIMDFTDTLNKNVQCCVEAFVREAEAGARIVVEVTSRSRCGSNQYETFDCLLNPIYVWRELAVEGIRRYKRRFGAPMTSIMLQLDKPDHDDWADTIVSVKN